MGFLRGGTLKVFQSYINFNRNYCDCYFYNQNFNRILVLRNVKSIENIVRKKISKLNKFMVNLF